MTIKSVLTLSAAAAVIMFSGAHFAQAADATATATAPVPAHAKLDTKAPVHKAKHKAHKAAKKVEKKAEDAKASTSGQ